MDTNEIYFPNGRREQFTDDELLFLKKEFEKFSLKNEQNYTSVDVDLPEKEILTLALESHRQDITLNQLIEKLLIDYMEKNQ